MVDKFPHTAEVPKYVEDEDYLFQGDIKLSPEDKAALLSDDATVESWDRAAQKWQRDRIPYVVDQNLCKVL